MDNQTILGIFPDWETADEALAELEEIGYEPESISALAKSQEDLTQEEKVENIVKKAGQGGVIGGLAGLLTGIAAVAIPGIGSLLIAGPLSIGLGLTGMAASAASGAATGVLAGGLIGALIGVGIPEEIANLYEEKIKKGGVLLAVPVREDIEEVVVKDIFEDNGAESIITVE